MHTCVSTSETLYMQTFHLEKKVVDQSPSNVAIRRATKNNSLCIVLATNLVKIGWGDPTLTDEHKPTASGIRVMCFVLGPEWKCSSFIPAWTNKPCCHCPRGDSLFFPVFPVLIKQQPTKCSFEKLIFLPICILDNVIVPTYYLIS